jgi:voltage-gated potassium channel
MLERRAAFNEFVERHEVAWELAMALLAIIWVALGALLDEVPTGSRPELEVIELALTGVFIIEFATRLAAAHDRLRYLRGHCIDALAFVPPIRALRVLRLIRLLRLIRAFSGIYRVSMHVEGLARHRGFAWLLSGWLGVMVICSAAVYAAEHGINKLYDSPFDALWWGVSTLTTVGYGDTYPVTLEGRLAAMILMLLGIGLFAAITASITSYFITQDRPAAASRGERLAQGLERLSALRESGSLTEEEFVAAKATALAQ